MSLIAIIVALVVVIGIVTVIHNVLGQGMGTLIVEPFTNEAKTEKEPEKIASASKDIYDTFYLPFYRQLFQPDYRTE
jgi:hypothetical protein